MASEGSQTDDIGTSYTQVGDVFTKPGDDDAFTASVQNDGSETMDARLQARHHSSALGNSDWNDLETFTGIASSDGLQSFNVTNPKFDQYRIQARAHSNTTDATVFYRK